MGGDGTQAGIAGDSDDWGPYWRLLCLMGIVNIQCGLQRDLGTPLLENYKILFFAAPLSVALPFLFVLAGKIDFSTKGLGLLAYFSDCEH